MNSIRYRDEDLKLRDGTILKSRIWLPSGKGPWPVLLMRQPYRREIASVVTYAHPSWWASNGYLVVIQDVRGQGGSEGRFSGFSQEASDTSETHYWVRSLPECNGLLGTYGFSYQGFTQLLAEDGTPPPDCMIPAMTGLSENEHWSCEGGAFWWHLGIGWGLQLAAQKAQREEDWEAWYEIRENLESKKYLNNGHELLKKIDPEGMANKWLNLSHRKTPQWKSHKPLDSWLKKPLLLIGGWWDPHLKGILDIFSKAKHAGGDPKLLIGPATHLRWWEEAQRTQLNFFDTHLKEKNKKHLFPQINLWNLTTKNWEISDQKKTPTWILHSEGLASISHQEGSLFPNSNLEADGEVNLVHDPWRPFPAIGGHLSDTPGEVNRFDLDTRPDVAVFTSNPISKDLRLEGIPILSLEAKCDRETFDLFVALSIIPNEIENIVTQISTGVIRISENEINKKSKREIRLQPLLATFKQGDRLRISISGSGWPAIGINPGQSKYLSEGPSPHCLVTTISLLLSKSKLKFESLISS
ncbi:CocE/NonD family hydrolase [Prochlorococcus marinus]|uniref:Alpha/beta hydrolase n=1 Tax=Prochlorococcus marinus XMU1408 TaxID=2213228 RepID=A0A318R4G6_PROMR|nr:CocE/NonD family hydrolase [Prochlorococcus marinus]MBW3041612.1 alpha/beta hydrolase [Prochlorococcus marinus str. XMU1408]PYE02768.1 alpha/beta hydrolase [Prochlorococcus marinus XMU1408]